MIAGLHGTGKTPDPLQPIRSKSFLSTSSPTGLSTCTRITGPHLRLRASGEEPAAFGAVPRRGDGALQQRTPVLQSQWGRYLSPDPVPSRQPFAYAKNNPVKFVDPSGRF
ncbi:MAG: hypothetical protein D6812_12435 [Deltaproteobacteria bacterium]|nr:MAG: hypothetical protein D6812_12435 [Deltaproteobacteria bacterium]